MMERADDFGPGSRLALKRRYLLMRKRLPNWPGALIYIAYVAKQKAP